MQSFRASRSVMRGRFVPSSTTPHHYFAKTNCPFSGERHFTTSDPWASLINIVRSKRESGQSRNEGKRLTKSSTSKKETKQTPQKTTTDQKATQSPIETTQNRTENKPQQTVGQPTVMKLLSQQKVLSWQEYKEAADLPLDDDQSIDTDMQNKKKSFAQHLEEKYGPEKAARIKKRLKRQKLGPWQPVKRLVRAQMEELRKEKETNPELKITDLAAKYGISYEAVERILRSKWQPPKEIIERQDLKKKERKQERFKKTMGASSS